MNQPDIIYTPKTETHYEAEAQIDGRAMRVKGDTKEDAFWALRNAVVQMLIHRGLPYAADEVGRTWKYVETP